LYFNFNEKNHGLHLVCAGCFALVDFVFPSRSLLVMKPPGGVLKFAFSFCAGFTRSRFLATSQCAGGFICLSRHWFSRSHSGLNPISVSTAQISVLVICLSRQKCEIHFFLSLCWVFTSMWILISYRR
jgi:hypothetical protein